MNSMPMLTDTYNIPVASKERDVAATILKGLDKFSSDRRDLFSLVLELEKGNVSEACRVVGIKRNTYNQWCLDYHEFRDQCINIQESLLDMAESKLITNVEGGMQRAIEFLLECKAKSRGYVKRREVTGEGGGPIKIIGELPKEQLELLEMAVKQGAKQEVRRLHEGDVDVGQVQDGETTEVTS